MLTPGLQSFSWRFEFTPRKHMPNVLIRRDLNMANSQILKTVITDETLELLSGFKCAQLQGKTRQ